MRLFTGEGAAYSYQMPSSPPGGEGQGWGGSLFPGHQYPEDRDDPTLSGFPLHPVSPLHGMGWGVGEWHAGRGRSGRCLGTRCPLGAGQQSTLVSPFVLEPMPPFQPSRFFPGLGIV